MSFISIDVDIDDVLSSCSRYDRLELIKALIEDGYLPKELVKSSDGYVLPDRMVSNDWSNDFDGALDKLKGRSWQLTKEEEQFIINISNRF